DGGLERSGLAPSDLDGIERLARLASSLPQLRFRGVAVYRGKSFPGGAALTNEAAGRDEARLASEVAAGLRARGVAVEEVGAGWPVAALAGAEEGGVTEVRAGASLFNDGAQVAAGSAGLDDVALTVLATVVSARPGSVTVDAGSKTFSASRPADADAPLACEL